jgi:hypothetical protein
MRSRAGFPSIRPSSASLRRRTLKFLCAPAILLVGILTLQLLFYAAIQDRVVAGRGRSQRGVDGHRETSIGDAASTGSSFEDSSTALLPGSGTTRAPTAGGALARYFKDEMPTDALAFHAGSGAADSIPDANAIWHARLQDALMACPLSSQGGIRWGIPHLKLAQSLIERKGTCLAQRDGCLNNRGNVAKEEWKQQKAERGRRQQVRHRGIRCCSGRGPWWRRAPKGARIPCSET